MTDLYRAFDASDQLLYVGIAENFELRLSQHESTSGWFDLAERVAVEWYESRSIALKAEAYAIRTENPLWNLAGSPHRADAQRLVATADLHRMTVPSQDELEALGELWKARTRRRFQLLRTAERRCGTFKPQAA